MMDGAPGDAKKFFYFQAIRLKAVVWADDEEHAKRLVQECVTLEASRHVPRVWMEPMQGPPMVCDW